ncbi:phage tail sheath family protein [Actinoplanes sp. NPDC000266]
MPVTPTYPGVYIEELPSAVRTITTVTTSVTAFVGHTARGPVNTPVTLTGFADFERRFGGLSADSLVSYAVQQFFLNGGSVAVVVRLAKGAVAASFPLTDSEGATVLTVTAREPGTWGDGLRVEIDHDAPGEDGFNLRVFDSSGAVDERHQGLTPDTAESVVNASSRTIEVRAAEGATNRPASSGTVSADLTTVPDLTGQEIAVSVGAEPDEQTVEFLLYDPDTDGPPPDSPARLALLLERKLRTAGAAIPALGRARVGTVAGGRLRVVPGDPTATVAFAEPNVLGLAGSRPGAYSLDGGEPGGFPDAADFLGSEDAKSGIHVLRDVEDVNLLCLPDVSSTGFVNRDGVLAAANALCATKRMFHLIDSPESWTSLDAARAGLPNFDPARSSYAALYFPRIRLTDPLTGRLREFPPSGAVAGVMARTDAQRGVWKAPAGTETRLSAVRELSVPLTDPENGLLNPLGVNCLRTFPVVGPVVWGARTLDGADQLASQWKYVPVRRLALMLEESLYRGTKWVVFEPNDETLWGQIRLNVGAFLHTLFQQGAFQGTSAREAYFVKVDRDTTTQDDINRGIVNVVVGFAPLKPAEFVIIKIEQLAGQVEV